MPLTDNSDSLETRNLTVHDSLSLGDDTEINLKEMSPPPTPQSGSLLLYAGTDGRVYSKNDAGTEFDLTAGATPGESNTASNVGTGGIGLFKQKTGTDLEFKNINAGSAKITVTDDGTDSEVDIDLGAVGLTDLSDVAAKTGTGTTAVMQDSPTLTTPAIGNLSNATHSHQNAAGAGTLDAAAVSSGTLHGDRLATKNKTVTKIVYIEDPTASDSFPIAFVADDITMVQVRGVTDQGTVDFNIEHRAANTPDVSGTDMLSVDLQATSAGALSSSFSDATVPGERWLNYNASAASGTATKLWVVIEYTID
jgi:hypothetical protein